MGPPANHAPPPQGRFPPLRLTTALLFLLVLAVYLTTACRDVYWFDSPEFTTTALNLDVSHPPGYPLYNFLAHLFTRLPVGPVPFRVAAFSAVAMAAGIACFFRFLLAMKLDWRAALGASLVLAFAAQVWSLAVIAEVYALELALLAGLLWSLAPDGAGRPMPRVGLSAFLAGCLVAHRPTDALFLPFFLGMAWLPLRQVPRAAAWFALAYLPYVYTWWHLRHASFSMAYFDYPADAATFFGILTGKLYAGNLFTLTLHDSLVELKNLLLLLARQLGPVLLFALAGLVEARRRDRPELLTILGIVLVNVVFCTNYNVIETNTMTMPALAMVCWLAALGADWALRALAARGPARTLAPVRLLVVAAPLLLLALNWSACDRSGFRDVSHFLRDLHGMLPAGARLLTATDVDTLAVLWGRFGLGLRKDLELTIVDNWKPDVTATVEAALRRGQAVFSCLFLVREQFDQVRRAFRLRRLGFLYRLELRDAGPDGPPAPGRTLAPGVDLVRAALPPTWETGPGLCALDADWSLAKDRALRRPGALAVLTPDGPGTAAAPTFAVLEPVSGLDEEPPPGLWADRYRFRLPPSLGAGRYRVELGVLDLSAAAGHELRLEPSSGAFVATGPFESFDPAEVPGLDFWKERQMQYLLAIARCAPYHQSSYRPRSVQALAGLAAPSPPSPGGGGQGWGELGLVPTSSRVSLGTVEVRPGRPGPLSDRP
ncbi:MAG: DUF2723 domain-containing protein [Candidatus Riflebacteria bacterium]|nr:DUF2723 domain-containing protein [Candidatus Riflebacteria bacterium]